ncbi:MAG TPA: NERD domain-containing protein [Kiritimatiellia bacterium]|nr:NERD domain-containing protein [Kiritimatiellia bacterium]
MIPPVLPCTAPPGEQEVFRRLEGDPDTRDWIVLHSLDIPRHLTQVSGEADFVIIVPGHGVAVLEVKSHALVRRNSEGLWFYGKDPNGEPRGPFRQAADAMHSIRRQLTEKRPELSRIVFWSGVVLPRASTNLNASDEWFPWQLMDASRFRGSPFSRLVLGLLCNARNHLAQSGAAWFTREANEPTPEQCRRMAEFLRPAFEAHQSPAARSREIHEELRFYTAEQQAFLDQLTGNPRLLVRGPAGTGKTVLAVESARRASESGGRAALLCFNRLLGTALADTVSGCSRLHASTVHRLMLDVAGISPPPDAAVDADFWSRQLPEAASAALLGREDDRWLFDEIVLDEFQDLQQQPVLDFLDLLVKGGLAAGRWRAFGDFARQSIFAPHSSPDALLAQLGSPAVCSLTTNCRNTPRIAEYVRQLGRLEPFYRRVLRPDDGVDPELRSYRDAEEQLAILRTTIECLILNGYKGSDIVVLSTMKQGTPSALSLTPGWNQRFSAYPAKDADAVSWTTIHAFKGLEAPVIIIADMDRVASTERADLFYVAITRALHRLVILLGPAARAEVAALLT